MNPDHTTQPTRRRVLGVTAGLGAAGALAACGGSSGGDAAAVESTSAPAASSSAVESSSSAAPAGGASLVAVADVPVGGGVIIAKPAVVVTQPEAGTFKGFSSICTHQSCPVANVEKGLINCTCHGSSYSIVDGSVKGGPAPAPLPPVTVKVEGDQVVEG